MKRLTLLLFIVGLTTNVVGQKYLTADIKSKADSILKTYIGDTVFNKYCVYDTNTYYEYKNYFGKSKWETLNKFKKTKGTFVEVDMRWFLSIPYPQCPSFNKVSGMTSFVLDSLLNPKGKPYLNFIPDFYWNKDSCHLISKEKALTIARQQELKPGIDTLNAIIKYDTKTKNFSWEVRQTLWTKKDAYRNDYGESEIVTIDALTGEIRSHQTQTFSTVY
jgi:hypothetical protein